MVENKKTRGSEERRARSENSFARVSRLAPRARRAMSLIEVLISMFVLLFGLMGVAAIFPVGNYYATESEKFDLASSIAQNAFEELKARGLLKTEHWHYAEMNTGGENPTAVEQATVSENYPDVGEYDTSVFQPKTIENGDFNANSGMFNIPGPLGAGHAFVLDPMGAAANIGQYNVDVFPRVTDIDGNVINLNNVWADAPSGLRVLSGNRWPMRRITVRDSSGLLRKTVAETIFRLRDDLAVEFSDEKDRPGIQRWDVVDLENTPNDPTDDTPLRRQYQGNYSWLATIVPTTGVGLEALQPSNSKYGQIDCDVSIVVFRKRDETAPTAERLLHAELLLGGELVIYSTGGTFAKDEVDAAVEGLRPGNWISLMGVNQTTGSFVMKWYRVLSLDDETGDVNVPSLGDTGLGSTGFNAVGRHAMLIGPDWPAAPATLVNGAVADLRAAILPGVISVVTKPLKMESSSLWDLE